jgi:hypothetical protein
MTRISPRSPGFGPNRRIVGPRVIVTDRGAVLHDPQHLSRCPVRELMIIESQGRLRHRVNSGPGGVGALTRCLGRSDGPIVAVTAGRAFRLLGQNHRKVHGHSSDSYCQWTARASDDASCRARRRRGLNRRRPRADPVGAALRHWHYGPTRIMIRPQASSSLQP